MSESPGIFARLAERLADEAPDNCLGDGATESEVAELERELGVTLPASYRRFLQEFGFTFWPDFVYGIAHGKLPGMRVLWQTRIERHEVEPPLPAHLVPFSPDGWGNHYCLDTAQLAEGECPVVFWDHEAAANSAPERTHRSFTAWLAEALEEPVEFPDDDAADAPSERTPPPPGKPGKQLPMGPQGICFRPPHRGAPPLDRFGNPVELHQRDQTPNGPIDELLRLDHRGKAHYARNHPRAGSSQ